MGSRVGKGRPGTGSSTGCETKPHSLSMASSVLVLLGIYA